MLRRQALAVRFDIGDHVPSLLKFLEKYADVLASLADAVLVRMTETLPDAILLTTDRDFHVCRRLGRQTVPHVLPG